MCFGMLALLALEITLNLKNNMLFMIEIFLSPWAFQNTGTCYDFICQVILSEQKKKKEAGHFHNVTCYKKTNHLQYFFSNGLRMEKATQN